MLGACICGGNASELDEVWSGAVSSGDGASLSSGLFNVIVGVGSVVSRREQGLFSDVGLS
jgi:hypothetical protein